ncbi:porin [Aquabacterium sp. J223]|uniref:porin n=1 Tax=Aquabacterium sp. J223 TaxID=2898431 RepID=UPI0021ADDE38|nr:porin [Aquabacterium sp. J223]UUX97117.1 porin [Aquabacterium sp. J223]
MQRSLRLAASAVALSPIVLAIGAAHAQSQVQVYGVIDVAAGQYGSVGPGPAISTATGATVAVTEVKGVHNGGVTTSFLGFRGTEDLGGGLSAKFTLESFLLADTGTSGRSATDSFWAREATVGLAGGFGEVRLGTNGNPMWLATLPVSAMGGNSRFSPIFRYMFNGGVRGLSIIDTAMTNSIRYTTPNLSGFTGNVALQAGEGRGSRYNYAASLAYMGGPLVVTAGLQSARHQPPPAASTAAFDQDMWVLGAAYNFGIVRLSAAYATVDNSAAAGLTPGVPNKSRIPQVGLTARLGPGQLQLTAGRDTNEIKASGATNYKRETVSAGYLYSLSKRTDIYAMLMNEKFSSVPATTPASAKKSGDSYMVGIRHAF